MKVYTTILTFLFVLLVADSGRAQQKIRYTSNLEAYVGTWSYSSGSETFTLVLKKGKENTSFFYRDCLIGGYKHVKNGQLVGDYTQNLPSEVTDSNHLIPSCPSFIGSNSCARPDCVTPNEVDFSFWDRAYGEYDLNGYLTLLSPTTVRFEVRQSEYWGAARGSITVPQDVVLTKVQ
jgi:hypothetical protein